MKLALGSKKSNKFINKNKYQMLNIDVIKDEIAQLIKTEEKQNTLLAQLDLRYACSHIPLDVEIRNNCNVQCKNYRV